MATQSYLKALRDRKEKKVPTKIERTQLKRETRPEKSKKTQRIERSVKKANAGQGTKLDQMRLSRASRRVEMKPIERRKLSSIVQHQAEMNQMRPLQGLTRTLASGGLDKPRPTVAPRPDFQTRTLASFRSLYNTGKNLVFTPTTKEPEKPTTLEGYKNAIIGGVKTFGQAAENVAKLSDVTQAQKIHAAASLFGMGGKTEGQYKQAQKRMEEPTYFPIDDPHQAYGARAADILSLLPYGMGKTDDITRAITKASSVDDVAKIGKALGKKIGPDDAKRIISIKDPREAGSFANELLKSPILEGKKLKNGTAIPIRATEKNTGKVINFSQPSAGIKTTTPKSGIPKDAKHTFYRGAKDDIKTSLDEGKAVFVTESEKSGKGYAVSRGGKLSSFDYPYTPKIEEKYAYEVVASMRKTNPEVFKDPRWENDVALAMHDANTDAIALQQLGRVFPKEMNQAIRNLGLDGVETRGAKGMRELVLASPRVFERAKKLSPEFRAMEDKAFDKIIKDEDAIIESYTKKHGNIINADEFRKEFIPEGYNGKNAEAFQEPASYLTKLAYKKNLSNDGEYALFTSGQSGAGKSTAHRNVPDYGVIKKESAVELDSNLSNYESAIRKIKEAKAAGKIPVVFYVYREPLDALENGVVKRMKSNTSEMGRIVPNEVIAQNGPGSWEVAKRLHDESYDVRFVDNSLGRGNAEETVFEELAKKINYPKDLKKQFDAKVTELHKQGVVDLEQLEIYTGKKFGGVEKVPPVSGIPKDAGDFMKATPEQQVSGLPPVKTSKTPQKLASGLKDSGLLPKDVSYKPIIAEGEDSVKKVINALKEAKPIRGLQEKLYSQERAKRVAKIIAMGEKVPGEKGYFAQLGQLKGPLPKAQFEGIRKNLQQTDVDNLFNTIEKHEVLSPFEKISAKGGLAKLFGAEGGQVPTKGEIKLLREVFPEDFIAAVLEKRPFMEKFWEQAGNILNLPRAMMTTADLSAPLRQGVFLIGKPKQWMPATKEMFKYAFSEKAYKGLMDDIAKRPTYKAMRNSKLSLTELGTDMAAREEAFMSNLAEKIPIFGRVARGTNRAYSGFLNKLRADTFDDLYKKSEFLIEDNPKIADDIAKFVNAATGRGDLGALNKASVVLNGVFFSPRLMASRLNLLNPKFYVDLEPAVRKEALKSLFAFAGVGATILGLAKLGGVEVGIDPRSADFGKMKVGDTRYDIWGGFQQYIVLASRLITGEMVSSTTGREFTLGEGYKPTTRLDIIQRFFESKTSPVTSFLLGVLKGETTMGEEVRPVADIVDRFIPMFAQDMFDLYREKGFEGIGMALPAIFGVGVQTYGDQIPLNEKTPSGKPTIKWRQQPSLGETIVNKITGKDVTGVPEDIQDKLREEKKADIVRQADLDRAKKIVIETGETQVVGDTKVYLEDGIVKTTRSETLLESKNKYDEMKGLSDEDFFNKVSEMMDAGGDQEDIANTIRKHRANDTAREMGFDTVDDWSNMSIGDRGRKVEEKMQNLSPDDRANLLGEMIRRDLASDQIIGDIVKRKLITADKMMGQDVGGGTKAKVLYEEIKNKTGNFFEGDPDREAKLADIQNSMQDMVIAGLKGMDMSPREKESQMNTIKTEFKNYLTDDKARKEGLANEEERWSKMEVNDRAKVFVEKVKGLGKEEATEYLNGLGEKKLITDSVREEFKYQWKQYIEENKETLRAEEAQKEALYSEAATLLERQIAGETLTAEEEEKIKMALETKPLNMDFDEAAQPAFATQASFEPAGGMRTDRHNNPTAFTTDVAKAAGWVEGVDYEVGDPFPNNPNLRTAKIIGDPVEKTIELIDKIGFFTQSGKPRWSYVAMKPDEWGGLAKEEKVAVIAKMYATEGGNGSLMDSPVTQYALTPRQSEIVQAVGTGQMPLNEAVDVAMEESETQGSMIATEEPDITTIPTESRTSQWLAQQNYPYWQSAFNIYYVMAMLQGLKRTEPGEYAGMSQMI